MKTNIYTQVYTLKHLPERTGDQSRHQLPGTENVCAASWQLLVSEMAKATNKLWTTNNKVLYLMTCDNLHFRSRKKQRKNLNESLPLTLWAPGVIFSFGSEVDALMGDLEGMVVRSVLEDDAVEGWRVVVFGLPLKRTSCKAFTWVW